MSVSKSEVVASIGIGIGLGSVIGLFTTAILQWALLGALFGAIFSLRRNKIANVLVGLGIIAMLVVFAWFTPVTHDTYERAYASEMRARLRYVAQSEETYFATNKRY